MDHFSKVLTDKQIKWIQKVLIVCYTQEMYMVTDYIYYLGFIWPVVKNKINFKTGKNICQLEMY